MQAERPSESRQKTKPRLGLREWRQNRFHSAIAAAEGKPPLVRLGNQQETSTRNTADYSHLSGRVQPASSFLAIARAEPIHRRILSSAMRAGARRRGRRGGFHCNRRPRSGIDLSDLRCAGGSLTLEPSLLIHILSERTVPCD